jgi:hypothetical protein
MEAKSVAFGAQVEVVVRSEGNDQTSDILYCFSISLFQLRNIYSG